ncbi:AsmA family protein, partial [Klebsiella pneumoniae]|uniref:AsmA family protein n=1 Tax=Klebsiella pneumoniae TaxID=573 RepID=UPI0027317D7A
MSLRVFPWLALEIEAVQVGNPSGFEDAPPLARIGRAVASVRVLPLISGRLETGAISLSDTELTLVRLANGQSNLDGL